MTACSTEIAADATGVRDATDEENRLDGLFFELGRRAALAQTHPEALNEAVLPQPESLELESWHDIVGGRPAGVRAHRARRL